MGGCSAPFCNNSSTKGYIMKVFPKDPQLRALWAQNVGRKDWLPTDHSYLCEVHFAPNMWEQKRADHKRKLKPNAVPTIFGFFIKKTQNQIDNIDNAQSSYNPPLCNEILNDMNNDALQTNKALQINDDIQSRSSSSLLPCDDAGNKKYQIQNDMNNEAFQTDETLQMDDDTQSTANNFQPTTSSTICVSCSANKRKNKLQNVNNQKQLYRIFRMRKVTNALKYKVRTLEDKINNDKYKKALNSLFTEDQIKALLNKSKSIRNWSNATIKRALELKFICGANGYEALQCQGMPLPSLRTLRLKLENFNFEPGISNKMFEFLAHKKAYLKEETDLECGLVIDEMAITSQKC